eukprot:527179-Rhodomonas_salina.1
MCIRDSAPTTSMTNQPADEFSPRLFPLLLSSSSSLPCLPTLLPLLPCLVLLAGPALLAGGCCCCACEMRSA